MYKIKSLAEINGDQFSNLEYDGDRAAFERKLNDNDIFIQVYTTQRETLWINKANIIDIILFSETEND